MPIIFKPVGNIGSKKLEIIHDVSGVITLKDIESILEKDYGIDKNDFEHIKLVANSETIKNNDKSYIVNKDNTLAIFIFSAQQQIKKRIEQIFTKSKPDSENVIEPEQPKIIQQADPEIQKSIDTKIEEEIIPTLDDDAVKLINEKNMKLFENEDFKSLVRIYYTNQSIMKTFEQFITHGNIVRMNIPKSEDNLHSYEAEIAVLKSLGINESDDIIKECLKQFNGHINLTLRFILCKKYITNSV